MTKKVLIITYYWPPSGGPGVQRVLKFAKYLPEFGWEPIILTVKNGEYPAIDNSLFKDIPENCKVFKSKAIEPTFLYRKFTGMKKDEKIPVANLAQKNISWKKKISNWIRLNLFIPDAKIGWIPDAVKVGKKIIQEEKPDIIFSSSPPPTVQLIAKKLAKWSGIKWVADFRDPWTDIYHYDSVIRAKFAFKRDIKLEYQVMKNADEAVVASKNIGTFLLKDNFPGKKVKVITNGFDSVDFEEMITQKPSAKFVIAYAGKINVQQNPENFWKALGMLKNENPAFGNDLEILLMGNISSDVLLSIEEQKLKENLNLPGYVSHPEMLKKLGESTLLLLLIPNTKKNISIIPGKLFEYMATNRFIVGIGPRNGDSALILNETKTGEMFDFDELENLKTSILNNYMNWKNKIEHQPNKVLIQNYTRKKLTEKLAGVFDDMVHLDK
jgi:glycosyltransferase involved in cell wall biosynthesis